MNDIDFLFGETSEQHEEQLFDFSNFFDVDVSAAKRKKMMKQFIDYFINNGRITQRGNHIIPKQYHEFLCELMSYRIDDERNKLKPCDIKTMFIGLDEYKNNSIMFYDICGNYNRVGVTQCLNGVQSHINSVLKHRREIIVERVLRDLIRDEIKQMKENITLPVECELSGETITDISQVHLDHYNDDFAKVAFDWLWRIKQMWQRKCGKWVDICNELYKIVDFDDKYRKFKNNKLNEDWINYHNTHTHLRIVSKTYNLKREKYKPNWDYLKINGDKIYEYDKTKSDK